MKTLQKDALADIEKSQADLVRTIEDSKWMLNRSQQLIDCHRQKESIGELEARGR